MSKEIRKGPGRPAGRNTVLRFTIPNDLAAALEDRAVDEFKTTKELVIDYLWKGLGNGGTES